MDLPTTWATKIPAPEPMARVEGDPLPVGGFARVLSLAEPTGRSLQGHKRNAGLVALGGLRPHDPRSKRAGWAAARSPRPNHDVSVWTRARTSSARR